MSPSPPPSASLFPNPTLSRATDSDVSPICVSGDSHPAPLSPDSDYEIVDVPSVDMGNITSQIDLSSFARGGVEVDPHVQSPELPSYSPIATDASHIPLIQISSTGSPPGSRPHRRLRHATALDPVVPPTRNELQHRDKERLMRTARKVGKVLGETPTLAMVDKRSMKMVELDIIPGPVEEGRSGGVKLKSGALKFGRVNGVGQGYHSFTFPRHHPRQLHTPPSSARAHSRTPPVLKVDCNMVNNSRMFKRRRSDSASISADGSGSAHLSSVSTNLTFDLLSPASPSRVRRTRSPRSPPSTTSSLSRSLANR